MLYAQLFITSSVIQALTCPPLTPKKNPEPTIRQPFIWKHYLQISYKYESVEIKERITTVKHNCIFIKFLKYINNNMGHFSSLDLTFL